MNLKILHIFTCLLLFPVIHSFSQNDTSVNDKEEISDRVSGDTILKRIPFHSTGDSVKIYRSGNDFIYMRYLDSLLKTKNDLTVDTINGNDLKSGKFKKEKISNTPPSPRRGISLNFLNNGIVKIIFWILAIGFICFILYKLFLTGGIFKTNPAERPVTEQQEDEVLEPSAYDNLIRQAVSAQNFRLATRYWYLQTLQKLAVAGIIEFSADKTNYEYLRELGGKTYQKEFASLTTNYEYVWYGKFDVSGDIYEKLQKDFRYFHQKI